MPDLRKQAPDGGKGALPQGAKRGLADLHAHSTASDGDLTPALLTREAAQRGLTYLALTDHDTLGGLEGAALEARAAGVCFIPGVELSIEWGGAAGGAVGSGGEFHLLGLGIRSPTAGLLEAIGGLSRRREERNREILERMRELGIEARWEEVTALTAAGKGAAETAAAACSVGRPHFANLLIQKRIVRNQEQAFARYLGKGKPLYVPKTGLAFEEAAALIRDSGGVPVLAHPMSLFVAWGRLPDIIKSLKDRGLMGIEAWHPSTSAASCRRLEALGKTLGLYITEGSDFHGSARRERKLGCSHRGRNISGSVAEAIPELWR